MEGENRRSARSAKRARRSEWGGGRVSGRPASGRARARHVCSLLKAIGCSSYFEHFVAAVRDRSLAGDTAAYDEITATEKPALAS